LRGQELEVLRADKKHILVRAPDGLSLKLPRLWTDVDGADGERGSSGDAIFTVESLRELAALVQALARRGSDRPPERFEVPESPAR
jgi:hypothetical protein